MFGMVSFTIAYIVTETTTLTPTSLFETIASFGPNPQFSRRFSNSRRLQHCWASRPNGLLAAFAILALILLSVPVANTGGYSWFPCPTRVTSGSAAACSTSSGSADSWPTRLLSSGCTKCTTEQILYGLVVASGRLGASRRPVLTLVVSGQKEAMTPDTQKKE